MIGLSCIVYGMAFAFFTISGALVVEQQSDSRSRASAQGLFMVKTNGVGAAFGSLASGFLTENFFTAADGRTDWHGTWLSFALYAMSISIVFVTLFKNQNETAAMLRAQQCLTVAPVPLRHLTA